jgi:uncharacterized membrane protein
VLQVRGRVPSTAVRRAGLAIGSAIALSLAITAGPAGAANSVTVTTPYPSVEAAAGSKVSLDLTIKGTTSGRVSLNVSGVPSGWSASLHGGGFIVGSVLVDPKTSPDVKLQVSIPDSATPGTYHMIVRASGSGINSLLPIDITIPSATSGGVAFSTDYPQLRGPVGTDFTFNLTLNNDSPADVTYTVQAQAPDGWQIKAQPGGQTSAASATVTAGNTSSVSVTATPPDGVAAGTYPVVVTATANGQPVVAQLSVEITGDYKMQVSTPDQRLSTHGPAGSATEQQITVTNTGSAPLTGVKLTSVPPSNWKVTFDKPSVSIAPNSTATITATIVPSGDAVAGDYVVTFNAAADQSSATGKADIRFTVETSALWAIVGIGIIAIALGSLGWVFRRYGRR